MKCYFCGRTESDLKQFTPIDEDDQAAYTVLIENITKTKSNIQQIREIINEKIRNLDGKVALESIINDLEYFFGLEELEREILSPAVMKSRLGRTVTFNHHLGAMEVEDVREREIEDYPWGFTVRNTLGKIFDKGLLAESISEKKRMEIHDKSVENGSKSFRYSNGMRKYDFEYEWLGKGGTLRIKFEEVRDEYIRMVNSYLDEELDQWIHSLEDKLAQIRSRNEGLILKITKLTVEIGHKKVEIDQCSICKGAYTNQINAIWRSV